MKFFKTLFFISLLSVFLSGCQFLGIRKATADSAQEKFIELENQYRNLLAFSIESSNLEKLQKKYRQLSTESENILLSESPEKKLSQREKKILNRLKEQSSKRIRVLEDLKD